MSTAHTPDSSQRQRMDHTLSVAVTQQQYRSIAERAWRRRQRIGEYVRELLDQQGALTMPDQDEAEDASRPPKKTKGGAR